LRSCSSTCTCALPSPRRHGEPARYDDGARRGRLGRRPRPDVSPARPPRGGRAGPVGRGRPCLCRWTPTTSRAEGHPRSSVWSIDRRPAPTPKSSYRWYAELPHDATARTS
jgi:hypothetical protein